MARQSKHPAPHHSPLWHTVELQSLVVSASLGTLSSWSLESICDIQSHQLGRSTRFHTETAGQKPTTNSSPLCRRGIKSTPGDAMF